MQYNCYFNYEYPYQYQRPCYFWRPMMLNPYGYVSDNLYRENYNDIDEYAIGPEDEFYTDDDILEDKIEHSDEKEYLDEGDSLSNIDEEMNRGPRDVKRVIKLVESKIKNVISEITRIGVDKKLTRYFIKIIVNYIDENFDNYKGSIDKKVEVAFKDIRNKYPWIFDILQIFSISPATISNFIDNTIRTAFSNLRDNQPSKPNKTPVIMPRY